MNNTIYLVRHAQSHPTKSRHYSDWPLSAKGRRQAEMLAGLLEDLDIQHIASSPFIRCLHTIDPFARRRSIDVEVVYDLRERLITKEIIDGFYDVWCRSWDDFEFALPGCESSADAQVRFVRAVSAIADRTTHQTAVCSHGNVIGLLLNYIDSTAGRKEAEGLTNPDVVKVIMQNDTLVWDRSFRLDGLVQFATDHRETPFGDAER